MLLCSRIIAAILLAMCVQAATAQQFKSLPALAKASEIFENLPSKVIQGTFVAFEGKRTPLAFRTINSGVQVRVFALNDSDNLPQPIDTKEDCSVYISYAFPLKASKNGKLEFRKLDEGWLNLTASQLSIKEGRYYIVFEKAGPIEKIFGLRSSDSAAYFESGFLLTVSDDGNANIEKVKSEYERRRGAISSLRRDIDTNETKAPCYRYVKVATDEKTDFENLAMCAKGELAG